jgi:polar amino acid transport system substrate-binding protein
MTSEKAANLTHSLLAFSRKQIITFRPLDLNEIVKRFEKFIIRIIGEDIELRVILTVECLTVMVDSGQIEQVLMNLATNARDAMPGGGILTVKTERVHVSEGLAGLTITPGDYAVISVSDTGAGMDEATKQRIFEPFFTTKGTGKGTGLGLSIVYGIIKQHNGEVTVYGEPGTGTTFKINLRLVDASAERVSAAQSSAPKRGSETILVAEDDDQVRRLSRTILEEYGYTVIEAVDGEDAVAKFIENKDKIQLLLLDVIMPKMNGKETYEEIKKMAQGIRVIFSSGYTADIIHKKGLLEEGITLILKPVNPNMLLSKVREVLDK